ncbi:tetratricopeptide repeat protein [Okeanomitos corallinicola TIOX110]|uniref:Tetratricopeptide repeat protein n=1 Tax=Okeanomitos corallinicola TIOX110 TaxID=3133117 RepID=A0ABZ2UV55_9CYAN
MAHCSDLTPTIQHNLAILHQLQGHYTEAETLFQEVLEIKRDKCGKDHPSFAHTLNALRII